jgi:hypothetical protein
MDLQVGGTSQFKVSKIGDITIPNTGAVLAPSGGVVQIGGNTRSTTGAAGFSNGLRIGGVATLSFADSIYNTSDVYLLRDGLANTLAQRNATNPQAFRVYNTYTDASNYERVNLTWQTSVARWQSEAAGTGTVRNMEIIRGSTSHWFFNSAGNNFGASLLAQTDSLYDIGASGANRPRNVYVGVDIIAGGSITVGSASLLNFFGRTMMISPSDGVLRLSNNAQDNFGRLQFGGTTSSFPSLKRNTTALETKLADDSAYAPHAMQYLDVTDGITAPGAATGRARIYVDTADGDLKVVFADGTVKTIVTDT